MLTTATTVKEALEAGRDRLAEGGIDLAGLKCEWLLSHLLECRRLELALHYREEVPVTIAPAYADGLDRLVSGEPIQYVTGETEFMGLSLQVDPRVLIPRPETEQLVEQVLKTAKACPDPSALSMADVGTGSGCIAIALATALPDARISAFDISEEALDLARENARRHGLTHIHFEQGDLLENQPPGSIDLVAANLPYIARNEMAELPAEVKDHEPGTALEGGPDGLRMMEKLIMQCASVLRPEGSLFLEIGETQGDRLQEVMDANRYTEITLRSDLAGRPRFLSGMRPSVVEGSREA